MGIHSSPAKQQFRESFSNEINATSKIPSHSFRIKEDPEIQLDGLFQALSFSSTDFSNTLVVESPIDIGKFIQPSELLSLELPLMY